MQQSDSHEDDSLPAANDVKQSDSKLSDAESSELDARTPTHASEVAGDYYKITRLRTALRRWIAPISIVASVIAAVIVVYEMRLTTSHQAAIAPATNQSKSPRRARSISDEAIVVIAPPLPVVGPVTSPVLVAKPEMTSMDPPMPEAIVATPNTVMDISSESPAERTSAGSAASSLADNAKVSDTAPTKSNGIAAIQTSGGESRPPAVATNTKADAQDDAKLSLAMLAPLAGHYNYETYRIIKLSGEVADMKQLGYTAAALDIDAQGTLMQRMTMADGTVETRSAKILQLKLNGRSGHWTVLWSDLTYPIEASITFDTEKLSSRAQFENMADIPRFGDVELARLKRVSR